MGANHWCWDEEDYWVWSVGCKDRFAVSRLCLSKLWQNFGSYCVVINTILRRIVLIHLGIAAVSRWWTTGHVMKLWKWAAFSVALIWLMLLVHRSVNEWLDLVRLNLCLHRRAALLNRSLQGRPIIHTNIRLAALEMSREEEDWMFFFFHWTPSEFELLDSHKNEWHHVENNIDGHHSNKCFEWPGHLAHHHRKTSSYFSWYHHDWLFFFHLCIVIYLDITVHARILLSV